MALEYRNGQVYYYRKRRYGNTVVSEYLGKGETAYLTASLDRLDRQDGELKRQGLKIKRTEEIEADNVLNELESRLVELFSIVAKANGYHKPKRQWRKKRLKI